MRGMRRALALLVLIAAPTLAQIPPATVAVAFDRTHINAVLAEGFADNAAARAVTADDPVRVASVSKLVTALGVMRLVDAGKLELDRDVSDYLGYPLRNPSFPDKPITLRLLLSHQSSLLDAEDAYIIPFGDTVRRRLGEPYVWDSVHAPGSGWFHYTNLNFPVIASVLERVTGERFDRLMSRLVLKPLKLDACFNWSGCSPAGIRRAVVLYRATGEVAKDDLRGQPPSCPVVTSKDAICELSLYRPGDNGALFSPQGGLRISMRDLARIGQMLARGGRGFLSRKAFAEMTRPQWSFDGTNGLGEDGTARGFFCAYGLAIHLIGAGGPGCHDNLFGDGTLRLGHSGDAYGLRSGLWFDPATGRGLAFFTSAVADDAPNGRSAFSAEEERVVAKSAKVSFR